MLMCLYIRVRYASNGHYHVTLKCQRAWVKRTSRTCCTNINSSTPNHWNLCVGVVCLCIYAESIICHVLDTKEVKRVSVLVPIVIFAWRCCVRSESASCNIMVCEKDVTFHKCCASTIFEISLWLWPGKRRSWRTDPNVRSCVWTTYELSGIITNIYIKCLCLFHLCSSFTSNILFSSFILYIMLALWILRDLVRKDRAPLEQTRANSTQQHIWCTSTSRAPRCRSRYNLHGPHIHNTRFTRLAS